MGLSVIILAAGKGKRMASALPKVMHSLGGRPLLEHVIQTALKLETKNIHVVYGNGGFASLQALESLPVNWVEQKEQLGTGHAVLQALPHCHEEDRILVLYGDVPLVSLSTLQHLLQTTPSDGLGIIVAKLSTPIGFGRIIRDNNGKVIAIVEDKDATDEQRQIKEINTGILTGSARHFKEWLPQLSNENQQREYYLTDVIARAIQARIPVNDIAPESTEEIQGVNDHLQLAYLERYYQEKLAQQLMLAGVSIIDPKRIDIRGDVEIAADALLDINVVLEGKVSIGKNSKIGPNVILKNVEIGEDVIINANSIIEGAIIKNNCQIGPFARIRPDTIVEQGAKIGNFVEVKKTRLGPGSKANHLTYLGDAIIGANVNIGAGTITCNYDGVNKWQTEIQDGVFIGSNSSLIAPVTIAKNATVGAGSTITKDVASDQLALSRAKQVLIDGWSKIKKLKKK